MARAASTQLTQAPQPPAMPPWGVLAYESHHAATFRMKMWSLPTLTLLYVLRGQGEYQTPAARACLAPGDFVVIPIGQSYRLTDVARLPMSLVVICVERSLWQCDDSLASALQAERLIRAARLSAEVPRLVRELLIEQSISEPGWKSAMRALTLRLLTSMLRNPLHSSAEQETDEPRMEHRLTEVLATMRQRFFEPMDLDRTAAEAGMSRRSFTAHFRERTGSTWLDYLHRLRIDHALALLESTDRTVTSIAFECGYDHLSTFYRAFQKQCATSPEAWRHRIKTPSPRSRSQ